MPFPHDATTPDETVRPWLDPEPAPWLARSLSTLLLALFAAGLAFAAWVQVPDTVTSHFVLRPVGGADPVRTARAGEVTVLRVALGEPVEDDQELAVVRSTALGEGDARLREREAELLRARERRALEEDAWQSRRRAREAEGERLAARVDGLGRQLEISRRELALADDIAARYRRLGEAGVASETDLARHELESGEARLEVETLASQRDEARAALRALRHELTADQANRAREQSERAGEIERLEIQLAALRRERRDAHGDELSLRAPCRGHVLRLHVQGPGSLVREGDVLAEVSCDDAPLEALLSLPQADVALLREGQGVKLLYDALPHERYGVRQARLRWVSPASVEVEGRPVFRALAGLASDRVSVDGRDVALRAGMEGRARIVVGRQSLLAHAFEPLRRLREVVADVPSGREAS